MQIVMNIDESTYNYIMKYHNVGGWVANTVTNAILEGTPLHKGHVRIADMDEAIKCIKEVEGDDAIWAISLIEWACGKRTIIEADKESER